MTRRFTFSVVVLAIGISTACDSTGEGRPGITSDRRGPSFSERVDEEDSRADACVLVTQADAEGLLGGPAMLVPNDTDIAESQCTWVEVADPVRYLKCGIYTQEDLPDPLSDFPDSQDLGSGIRVRESPISVDMEFAFDDRYFNCIFGHYDAPLTQGSPRSVLEELVRRVAEQVT